MIKQIRCVNICKNKRKKFSKYEQIENIFELEAEIYILFIVKLQKYNIIFYDPVYIILLKNLYEMVNKIIYIFKKKTKVKKVHSIKKQKIDCYNKSSIF